jgi:2-methylcitrate dehydratase PrpD
MLQRYKIKSGQTQRSGGGWTSKVQKTTFQASYHEPEHKTPFGLVPGTQGSNNTANEAGEKDTRCPPGHPREDAEDDQRQTKEEDRQGRCKTYKD